MTVQRGASTELCRTLGIETAVVCHGLLQQGQGTHVSGRDEREQLEKESKGYVIMTRDPQVMVSEKEMPVSIDRLMENCLGNAWDEDTRQTTEREGASFVIGKALTMWKNFLLPCKPCANFW